MNNMTKLQVSFHSEICSRISGNWWGGKLESPELLVVNSKVWFHYHIGNDCAWTPKSASSDNKPNNVTSRVKDAVTVISHLQHESADPKVWNTWLYEKTLWNWQRNVTFNRASHGGKQRHCKHFSADTGRARARCYHSWTTCCRKWTREC